MALQAARGVWETVVKGKRCVRSVRWLGMSRKVGVDGKGAQLAQRSRREGGRRLPLYYSRRNNLISKRRDEDMCRRLEGTDGRSLHPPHRGAGKASRCPVKRAQLSSASGLSSGLLRPGPRVLQAAGLLPRVVHKPDLELLERNLSGEVRVDLCKDGRCLLAGKALGRRGGEGKETGRDCKA